MPGMRPEDIGLITAAGAVAIAPDGQRAVYAVTTQDVAANRARTRLWMASEGGPPRPFTAGDGDRLPRWSPDGSMVAWVAADGDGPGTCVMVASADGAGQPAVVCRWEDQVTELAWSPTGERLAFVGRVRDRSRYGTPEHPTAPSAMPPRRITRLLSRHDGIGWVADRPTHVHVVAVDGGGPPLALTSGEAPAEGVAWSPDGRRLVYVSGTHDTWDLDGRNDLWVIDADGGEPTRLTGTAVAWSLPAWSPDGTRLAALVNPTPLDSPRHGQLWVLPVDDPTPVRWATDLDRNLAPYGASRPPAWVGDELLVGVEDEGRLHVLAVTGPEPGGGSGSHRVVVGGERVVRSWDVAGGRLAWSATTFTEPGELWTARLDGSVPERKVSDHAATLRSRVELVVPEAYIATSSDGAEVPCWAMRPAGASADQPCPTVLNIHGGPFTQYGVGFFDEFQLQVGAGIGVVFCNPRGSSGYDEAWGRAIRWPEAKSDPGSGWGGVDFEDVIACVDEATRRFDWVDGQRLGVQGGSYGGYLTSWIVGHSRRFRAAVSERAVNDLVTMEHNSDISGFFRDYVGWTHLERPELYVRHSPATYAADMHTPMLMMHSEEDLRCPISQAEELFVALRLMGRHPELVRFPAECHELSRSGSPKHRVQRAEIILEWFGRHLG